MDKEIKVIEPTLGIMVKIAPILIEKTIKAIYGEHLIDILEMVTNATREELEGLNPDKSKELLSDFFTSWNPSGWISENMGIVQSYQKSLPKQAGDSEIIKKPISQE